MYFNLGVLVSLWLNTPFLVVSIHRAGNPMQFDVLTIFPQLFDFRCIVNHSFKLNHYRTVIPGNVDDALAGIHSNIFQIFQEAAPRILDGRGYCPGAESM